jgi:DNA helicase-2/ATP-dependent DNA helicase PcrA
VSPDERAVTHPSGPLIVIGGAGTGKTTLLARRGAWLVEQGSHPESLLVISHSDAAADVLRERVEELLARPYEELLVLTPHGVSIPS